MWVCCQSHPSRLDVPTDGSYHRVAVLLQVGVYPLEDCTPWDPVLSWKLRSHSSKLANEGRQHRVSIATVKVVDPVWNMTRLRGVCVRK